MEKQLYHVVEFYLDPDTYVVEVYRGIFSAIPENLQFICIEQNQIVIKAFPVVLEKETSFNINDDGQVILAAPRYYKVDWSSY